MQQKKIEQLNGISLEQPNALIKLNEAIKNLKELLFPNSNQQQIIYQRQNQNSQEQKYKQSGALNSNKSEEPYNIFTQFSNPNSDPSSQKTSISTMTKYKEKLNKLFPELLKAQEYINSEWNKLEKKYQQYYLQTQELLVANENKKKFNSPEISSFESQYRDLQQQLQNLINIQNDSHLTFYQKQEIKNKFSDLLQDIQQSNYLDDEVEIKNEKFKYKRSNHSKFYESFKPIPLYLEENVENRFNKHVDGIQIQENWRSEIVFPLFEKMDQIQRKSLQIKNYLKKPYSYQVEQEVNNCLSQMKNNYTTDLRMAVLCVRFSKLIIQSMIALYETVEEITEKL